MSNLNKLKKVIIVDKSEPIQENILRYSAVTTPILTVACIAAIIFSIVEHVDTPFCRVLACILAVSIVVYMHYRNSANKKRPVDRTAVTPSRSIYLKGMMYIFLILVESIIIDETYRICTASTHILGLICMVVTFACYSVLIYYIFKEVLNTSDEDKSLSVPFAEKVLYYFTYILCIFIGAVKIKHVSLHNIYGIPYLILIYLTASVLMLCCIYFAVKLTRNLLKKSNNIA